MDGVCVCVVGCLFGIRLWDSNYVYTYRIGWLSTVTNSFFVLWRPQRAWEVSCLIRFLMRSFMCMNVSVSARCWFAFRLFMPCLCVRRINGTKMESISSMRRTWRMKCVRFVLDSKAIDSIHMAKSNCLIIDDSIFISNLQVCWGCFFFLLPIVISSRVFMFHFDFDKNSFSQIILILMKIDFHLAIPLKPDTIL